MVRALFLDLDDTLFDRAAAFDRWITARLGDRLDDAQRAWLVEIDGRGRRPRADFLAALAARYGLAIAVDAFPHELAAHVEPEPGVRDAIAAHAAAGLAIAVVTNGGAAQRAKLERAGVADLIRQLFVSGELGVAKPDRAPFSRALAWAGVDPRTCLSVGDDPTNDIAPAASLGMATAWLSRGATWPAELAPPTHAIATFAELGRCTGIAPVSALLAPHEVLRGAAR